MSNYSSIDQVLKGFYYYDLRLEKKDSLKRILCMYFSVIIQRGKFVMIHVSEIRTGFSIIFHCFQYNCIHRKCFM